jgi:AcrR family transcriptional regulator
MATRISEAGSAMRKAPQQARSRATVQAIVDAGAQVLAITGWAKFTTNEVAEAAGVSIGSLYQYFPNKVSLVEAIRGHHLDSVLLVLKRISDDNLPLRQRVEQLITGMIEIHSINPALHRVLLEEAPMSERARAAHKNFESEYLRRYRRLIWSAGSKPSDQSCEISAQILSSALAGVIHDAARKGNLRESIVQRELVRLVRSYLKQRA